MKSDWLEAFLVFSETLNFTRAAERLHISQPALHVKVGKLSEFVGKPLYRKVGRNLVLTAEGERLQAYSREQAEHAVAFLEELRTGKSNRPVCLCAGEGAYNYLLGDAISRFLKFSDSHLEIIVGNQERTIQAVQSGEAHLGVTAVDSVPDNLRAEKLTQVEQVLVIPRSHHLAEKPTIHPADLRREKLVVPPKHRPHRVIIDRILMDSDVEWRPAIEVNGWELMLNFVKLGLGAAIVNACCNIPRTLVARPIKGFPKIQFCIIQRKGAILHPGVDRMRSLLFECGNNWKSG